MTGTKWAGAARCLHRPVGRAAVVLGALAPARRDDHPVAGGGITAQFVHSGLLPSRARALNFGRPAALTNGIVPGVSRPVEPRRISYPPGLNRDARLHPIRRAGLPGRSSRRRRAARVLGYATCAPARHMPAIPRPRGPHTTLGGSEARHRPGTARWRWMSWCEAA